MVLQIIKTSDRDGQRVRAGDLVTYTLTVRNSSSVDLTNVVVDDPKTEFNTVIPLLRVGEVRTFTTTWTVTEEEEAAGTVLNHVTAQGDPVQDPADPAHPKLPWDDADHTLQAGRPPVTNQVTVYYWYNRIGGDTAHATFNSNYAEGASFRIVSPVIPGYSVDTAVVQGVMGTEDLVYHVIYTPAIYHLTILYMDTAGNIVATDHQADLPAGSAYSVPSPGVEGLWTDRPLVEGTMPAMDVEIIVFYYPSPSEDGGQNPYTVLEDYDTPLGVGNTSLNAGECIE